LREGDEVYDGLYCFLTNQPLEETFNRPSLSTPPKEGRKRD